MFANYSEMVQQTNKQKPSFNIYMEEGRKIKQMWKALIGESR